MAAGQPDTLTEQEVAPHREPLNRPPQPVPVYAWVRYGTMPVRVPAWALMWTERATKLRWLTIEGVEHKAWVWSSAVDVRRTRDNETPIGLSKEDQALIELEHAVRTI